MNVPELLEKGYIQNFRIVQNQYFIFKVYFYQKVQNRAGKSTDMSCPPKYRENEVDSKIIRIKLKDFNFNMI